MLEHARSGVIRLAAILAVVIALAAVAFATPVAAQDDTVTVTLDELNDSGVSGTATLTPDGDSTVVAIAVDGATGDHPAHIHLRTCDDLNANPEYGLNDVTADGASETTVDVSLDTLLEGEYAINLHASPTNMGTYIACGNIVASADTGDDDTAADTGTGGTTTTTTPATGVGSAALSTTNSMLIVGLGATATILLAGGMALRRREERA